MLKISICSDFSDTPGGRFIKEGPYSGEQFRDTLLREKIEEAKKHGEILEIDFDGCYGIGTSFLEEAFGGFVRKYHFHGLLEMLQLVSTEDETIPGNIRKYVKKAEEEDK